MNATRSKRILRDLNEVLSCPVERASVCLFGDGKNGGEEVGESDIGVWHCNVGGQLDSIFEDLVLHFTIEFPSDYPSSPPRVEFRTFVNHLNVIPNPTRGTWEVCLDMLSSRPPTSSSVAAPYVNWSSVLSARSVLMQLTSFLLCEAHEAGFSAPPHQLDDNGDLLVTQRDQLLARMRNEAQNYACSHCNHCRSRPVPELPTAQQVSEAPHSYPPVAVSSQDAVELRARRYARMRAVAMLEKSSMDGQAGKIEEPTSTWNAVAVSNKLLASQGIIKSKTGGPTISLANLPLLHAQTDSSVAFFDCWSRLTTNGTLAASFGPFSRVSGTTMTEEVFPYLTTNDIVALMATCRAAVVICDDESVWKRLFRQRFPHSALCPIASKKPNGIVIAGGGAAVSESSLPTTTSFDSSSTISVAVSGGSGVGDSAPWTVVKAKVRKPKVVPGKKGGKKFNGKFAAPIKTQPPAPLAVAPAAAVPAPAIPPITVVTVSGAPEPAQMDLSQLGNVWKHTYMLELNGAASEPTCFFSRRTRHDSVLGVPLVFTRNPKTKQLDYVTSTFDVLSYASFTSERVRHTAWGEPFTAFLPLYLDPAHYAQAAGILRDTATELTGFSRQQADPFPRGKKYGYASFKQQQQQPKGPASVEEAVIKLLTSMMNTQVVLVCDNGVAASDSALVGYCQLHRLLLQYVSTNSNARAIVRRRLHAFVHDPTTRVKSATPSMGEFLALVSVSDTYSWKDLWQPILLETFDRSVLWACTKDEELAQVIPGDETRLDRHLKAATVTVRLVMFHAVFLRLLASGGGKRGTPATVIADRYDTFLGRPPMYVRQQWTRAVRAIMQTSTWPEVFRLADIPLPSKNFLLSKLERAVMNSLSKGYHTATTRFNRVHRSGVSSILLKGESYTAAPNLRRVRLCEAWRYRTSGTLYLDASCMIYDFEGERLGVVDYVHRIFMKGSIIRHSGDVVDDEKKTGEHTIDIDLRLIPRDVARLVFTISAWTTTLDQVDQASVRLVDADNEVEMCRYSYEDTAASSSHTAVVMCMLHRDSQDRDARWKLTTIGAMCHGRTSDYEPLFAGINASCGPIVGGGSAKTV